MTAVEDHQLAVAGNLLMDPPKVVPGQFFGRWLFERGDPHSAWVDAFKNVTDRAVFAPGVHGLEHEENSLASVGPQQFLKLLHLLVEGEQMGFALVFVVAGPAGGGAGVPLGQLDL